MYGRTHLGTETTEKGNGPRKAVLRKAVLRKAVLRKAVLRKAVLRKAVLRKAVLRKAVLKKAVLRKAGPRKAVLLRLRRWCTHVAITVPLAVPSLSFVFFLYFVGLTLRLGEALAMVQREAHADGICGVIIIISELFSWDEDRCAGVSFNAVAVFFVGHEFAPHDDFLPARVTVYFNIVSHHAVCFERFEVLLIIKDFHLCVFFCFFWLDNWRR